MKGALLAAALLGVAGIAGAGLAGSASAQPYGGGGYYGPGPGGGPYGRPYGRDYDDEGPPPPRYRGEGPYGRPYGGPPPRFSTVCATSRGSCPIRPVPRNTPCGCEIPGFGYKRGAAY